MSKPTVQIDAHAHLSWLWSDIDGAELVDRIIELETDGCEPIAKTIVDTDDWQDGCYRNYTHIKNLEEVLPYFRYAPDSEDYDDCNIFRETLAVRWV